MIPVCVTRCEDCTPVQCIVRPGCGEEFYLGIGIGQPTTQYDIYFTNLITDITRTFRITTDMTGEVVFNMDDLRKFIRGREFRISAVEVGQTELAELTFEDGTTFTCAEVEFKNLYDTDGQPDCPAMQWLTPY